MKRCIVDVVPPERHAVLNATDPLVVEMAAALPAATCCSSPSTATIR